MRVIRIDDFLETADDGRAPAALGTSPIEGTAYDWNRIVTEGRAARTAADGGAWRIGQLALLVERRYRSGALKRFAEEIGESLGSVRRFRWVAGAYDPNARTRFAGLSFSHFQAVAKLPDRVQWLERARRGGWSVDRLVLESRSPLTASGTAGPVLRRPVDSAARSIARLAEHIDPRRLSGDDRDALTEAIDDLAARLAELRARLSAPRGRAPRLGRSPLVANGHRTGSGRSGPKRTTLAAAPARAR